MAKKKVRTITKVIYKEPTDSYNKKIKTELNELESKRSQVKGGFKGFLQKMSLNKAIHDKRTLLNAEDKLKKVKHQTEYGKALIEREKVKVELNQLKQKSQVNFNDLYKETKIYG